MSQQADNGGVQPNHNNSVPNINSEEPINPLPSNIGGSAHQPQLSKAQISHNELWTGEPHHYLPLYRAAVSGDWKFAKSFIDRDPNGLTAHLTADSQTVLHVAARCWQWGFVRKLLELLSPESIAVRDANDFTVLHFVAEGGSLKTAKALVQKNADLLQIVSKNRMLPLSCSTYSENKELVWYLSELTSVDSPGFPFFRPILSNILRSLILSGYLDIVLYFVQRHPNLTLANDDFGDSLLYLLASKPSLFFSGSNLGFLERLIYKFVHVEIQNSPAHLVMVNMEESTQGCPALQPRSLATQVRRWFKRLLWKAIAQLVAYVKKVRDEKLKHKCAAELVNYVCTQLSSMSIQEIKHFLENPKPILGRAVTGGIEEIVRTLLLNFPNLMSVLPMPKRNILQAAIEYRQVNIVNIIKEIHPSDTKNLSLYKRESGNTTLHLTGKLAPGFKLFSVSGAVLQMQRELQWYKEVENITFSYLREQTNSNNETAKDVFRTEHKNLAEQGEKWMKDTANSCMLVSALIATVLFTAAFTVPGGNKNDDKGIPIFLRTNAFTVFAISDALGLFSSLTSLLMFLAIITARYAVEDFLESLPKKLIIGLSSLFFSIAAMIIAFGATLSIVLNERWPWVFMPITLLASFPVAIFVILQRPLFIQMVWSTYGPSMFNPWPSRI